MSDSIDDNMVDQLLESVNNNDMNNFTKKLEYELLNYKINNIENMDNNNNDNNDNNNKIINIVSINKNIFINTLIFLIIDLIFINKSGYIYVLIKTIIFLTMLYIKKKYFNKIYN